MPKHERSSLKLSSNTIMWTFLSKAGNHKNVLLFLEEVVYLVKFYLTYLKGESMFLRLSPINIQANKLYFCIQSFGAGS